MQNTFHKLNRKFFVKITELPKGRAADNCQFQITSKF